MTGSSACVSLAAMQAPTPKSRRPLLFAGSVVRVVGAGALLAAMATAACGTTDDENPPEGELVSECAPLDEAAATEHAGAVAANEVWGPGLHIVTDDVEVGAGALLTLQGCAVVRLAPDASIVVDDEAVGFVADGKPTRRILLERRDADAPWGAVHAAAPATLRLSHTTLRGGGSSLPPADANFAGATLAVRSFGSAPVDLLFVEDVVVEGSRGLGVFLQGAGFVTGSRELTVRGASTHPVYVGAGFATNLPTGQYVDNGVDAFLLQLVGAAVYDNDAPILHDATLPARGLPYQVGPANTGADIVVGDGRDDSPSALLRIEAGVELRFRRSDVALGRVLVNGKGSGATAAPQGALVVAGTPEAPVVFTSMEPTPAAGDWQGLYFATAVDDRSRIEHASVRYAGGESLTTGVCKAAVGASHPDADCAVVFFTAAPPPSAFVTGTSIEDGAGCGVYRGWPVADVDFTAGNTFENLKGCTQSNVPDASNGCDTGPCK